MSAVNLIADIPSAMDLSGGAGGTSSIGGGDGVGGFRGGIGARLLCGSAAARRNGSSDFCRLVPVPNIVPPTGELSLPAAKLVHSSGLVKLSIKWFEHTNGEYGVNDDAMR